MRVRHGRATVTGERTRRNPLGRDGLGRGRASEDPGVRRPAQARGAFVLRTKGDARMRNRSMGPVGRPPVGAHRRVPDRTADTPAPRTRTSARRRQRRPPRSRRPSTDDDGQQVDDRRDAAAHRHVRALDDRDRLRARHGRSRGGRVGQVRRLPGRGEGHPGGRRRRRLRRRPEHRGGRRRCEPDLFLTIAGGDQWKQRLRDLGIPVVTLDATDFPDLLRRHPDGRRPDRRVRGGRTS